MTAGYRLPDSYPSVNWSTPEEIPLDIYEALAWQKRFNVSGTVGQIVYAYHAFNAGRPPEQYAGRDMWSDVPMQYAANYKPASREAKTLYIRELTEAEKALKARIQAAKKAKVSRRRR